MEDQAEARKLRIAKNQEKTKERKQLMEDRAKERKSRIAKLQAASYNNQEKTKDRKQCIENLRAVRYNNNSNEAENLQRKELFSSQTVGRTFINFFKKERKSTQDNCKEKDLQTDSSSADTWAQDRLEQLRSSFNKTRNAFAERGERLNTLNEKTLTMKDACHDYSTMAAKLKKKNKSKGWW